MPADIHNFQASHSNFDRQFSFIGLIDYINKTTDKSKCPNFPKAYLPEMTYVSPTECRDVFMKTVYKTFEYDGVDCIRFLLLDKTGKIYPDMNDWTQVLPNSFLARVSCSLRNFDPSSVTLDYFIDMNEVQISNEEEYGSETSTLISKEIVDGYVLRGSEKIQIDSRIAEFNLNKQTVFLDFFKYDFGNAIKGLNLSD